MLFWQLKFDASEDFSVIGNPRLNEINGLR